MSTMTLSLPRSLHAQLEALAAGEGVSVDEFVALTLSEKVATAAYLEARAQRGSREALLEALAKAPDAEPDLHDRL